MQILFGIAFLSIITALFGFVFHAFGREKKYFSVATLATLVSFLCLTVLIIMQGIHYGFKPTNYISQPCNILAWLMLATYFFAENKYRMRILGALFIPIVTITMLVPIFGGPKTSLSSTALKGEFYINLHILLLVSSFTLFFLAFSEAVFYILKARALKAHNSTALDERLPSLEKLEKVLIGTFNLGWITMTAGLLISVISSILSQSGFAFNAKIIWGLGIWIFYTFLFFMHIMKKIDTRNLARSVTFLFIIVITFWVALSANAIGGNASASPGANTQQKGDK
jgi:ABC-type uncharacterized transport system permease subunit